jgi:peptide/nickel transport system permease protein
MLTYIVKRILLMIPTLLLIALIIFMVLNLAPGRPGKTQVGADGTQSKEGSGARESHRIFKEQFNFDKPILLNTRFAMERDEVEEFVGVIAKSKAPTCPASGPTIEGCITADEKPISLDVVKAVETLEDLGNYTVPFLYEIAADTSVPIDSRYIALSTLSQNAQHRLISQYGRKLSEEEKAYNNTSQEENQAMKGWVLDESKQEVTQDALTAVVNEKWTPWFKANEARYSYTAGEKVAIFFTDTRFYQYLSNLARLDFGVSHVDKKPVLETIGRKLKYSISLSLISILLSYLISVPLGVWSAYKQGSTSDKALTLLLFMLYSLPSFFVAVVLQEFLTVGAPLQVLPTGGFIDANAENMTTLEQFSSIAQHLTLPLICLSYGALASLSRYARTGVLDVIRADYIRTARAKGLGEGVVIIKHAVRNGMIPILTLLGSLLPVLIGGSVIIEVIFNIPGLGLYLFESISARDYNAIMAVLLISSVLTLIGLLISDLSYALVDPRISFD